MKTNIKQVVFVIVGLVIITAIFALTKLNTASADKKDGTKFEDWVVACTPKNDETKTPETCVLSQQINITKDDKQQPIALFQIGYLGPKKELQLVQVLPLGINIEAGTSIISSKKLIAPGKYKTCLENGCTAVASISDADLKALFANGENSVAFMNLKGEQITLPMSVKGLEKGLNYIK